VFPDSGVGMFSPRTRLYGVILFVLSIVKTTKTGVRRTGHGGYLDNGRRE
jgi:hypothetical protein